MIQMVDSIVKRIPADIWAELVKRAAQETLKTGNKTTEMDILRKLLRLDK
jgi:hypothetical protein